MEVLQSGFHWLIMSKDCYVFVKKCDRCQRIGNISRRDEMPFSGILELEIIYVWGMDFMSPFPASFWNLYILLAVDYGFKWVEAVVTSKNDDRTIKRYLQKNILTRYQGLSLLMRIATLAILLRSWWPNVKWSTRKHWHMSNGQAEVSNCELRKILDKTVNTERKDWSLRLDDAFWAYQTA